KRTKLDELLAPLIERLGSEEVARFASQSAGALERVRAAAAAVAPQVALVKSEPLDAELSVVVRATAFGLGDLVLWLGKLAAYLAIARKWYGFLFFGRKGQARAVLERFGLAVTAAAADRVARFLDGVRARRVL